MKNAAANIWVYILASFIGLIVLLSIIPAGLKKLGFFSEKLECNWSLITQQFQPPHQVACEPKLVTIDRSDVQEGIRYARQRIQTFIDDKAKNKEQSKYREVKYFTTLDQSKLYEFALDNLIAKELKDCWDKALGGKTEGYKWWNHFDFTAFGLANPEGETEEQVRKGAITTWKGVNIPGLNEPLLQVYGPPTTCMVCSRIKFENSLRSLKIPPVIRSMQEFLAHNPVPFDPETRSYYHYILAGQTISSNIFLPQYVYDINRPYVVIYKRIDTHQDQDFLEALYKVSRVPIEAGLRFFGLDVPKQLEVKFETFHTLELVPLELLTVPSSKNLRGGDCAILLNI